jgi:pyridoxamine 5'-phosphate oxidase
MSEMPVTESAPSDPFELLEQWLSSARSSGVPDPLPMAFVTVGQDGRPSARMVGLKLVLDGALVFTSALWTRKARELQANPHVSLLFHWPELGRQIHVAGQAHVAERALAERLFAERPIAHRLQSIVSRQGQPIDDLQILRLRHAHLMSVLEADPECPADWGAISVVPEAIEFWQQAPDRLHDRFLYESNGKDGWRLQRLAP